MNFRNLYIYSNLIRKNLFFRPVRSSLTIFGIAIACCVYVLMLYFTSGYEKSWVELFSSRGIDLFIMEKNKVDPLTSSLDESIVTRLLEIEGVKDVVGSLADILTLGDNTNVIVVGYENDSSYYNDIAYIDGSKPTNSDEVLVGRAALRNAGLEIGDTLELDYRPFIVSGVFEPKNVFEANSIIIDIDLLRKMRGVGNIYSSIGVKLELGKEREDCIEKIESLLSEEYPGAKANLSADFFTNNQMFRSLEQLVTVIAFLALSLILLGCMNTLGTAIFERTGEIGMLRAIGWSGRSIAYMVLGESLLLCFFGWVLGTGTAVLTTIFLMNSTRFLFLVSGSVGGEILLRSSILCLLGGLIGTLQPTIKAVRLDPADAYS